MTLLRVRTPLPHDLEQPDHGSSDASTAQSTGQGWELHTSTSSVGQRCDAWLLHVQWLAGQYGERALQLCVHHLSMAVL